MPLRILMVTGRSPAPPTASRRICRSRLRLNGSAEPPPLRVTFGTGQPKLRSMWSARSSATIIRTALPTVAGSTPYSWIERGVSATSKWMRCMVFSLRSTRARVVIISLTNSPFPALDSRHRVRKGALVMPAIGASTTGGHTVCGPIRRAPGAGGARVVSAVIPAIVPYGGRGPGSGCTVVTISFYNYPGLGSPAHAQVPVRAGPRADSGVVVPAAHARAGHLLHEPAARQPGRHDPERGAAVDAARLRRERVRAPV